MKLPVEAVTMNSWLKVVAGLAAAVLPVASPSNAQTPTTPPNIAAPHPAPPPIEPTSAPVTLTGCIERTKPQSTSDGGKTPPSSVSPATAYVLRSEPAPGAAQSRAVVYDLVATGPTVRFDDHVGHRVQLTGTLRAAPNQQPGLSNHGVSPSTRSTGMETMPTPDPMAAQSGVSSLAQPVVVESLKMLEGSCKGSTE
jgi:hypothetical protein